MCGSSSTLTINKIVRPLWQDNPSPIVGFYKEAVVMWYFLDKLKKLTGEIFLIRNSVKKIGNSQMDKEMVK